MRMITVRTKLVGLVMLSGSLTALPASAGMGMGSGMVGCPGTMGAQGMMGSEMMNQRMMGGQGMMGNRGMTGPGMMNQGMMGCPGMMGGQGMMGNQGMMSPGMMNRDMMGCPGMMGGQGMMGKRDMMGSGMMGGQGMMGPGMTSPGMMGKRGMMGSGMMNQGMMGMMMGDDDEVCPGMAGGALAIDAIDLTQEQRDQVRAIRDQLRREHWDTMGQIMEKRAQLRDLYDAKQPDPERIGEVFNEIAQLRRQMLETQIRAENQMRNLLTDQQREQLGQAGPAASGDHVEHHPDGGAGQSSGSSESPSPGMGSGMGGGTMKQ